ncbi:MAG TPA: glycosyltransferase, partial [Gaiellaceae bacterium]|nr:glycosyltransferase [Gaiellaceae bacterium]
MRILLVVHGFPPEEQSGTELYAEALAHALVRGGHDVCVFAGSHTAAARLDARRREGAVEVERCARPRRRLRVAWHDGSTEAALLALLDRFEPEAVHVQHLLGLTMPLIPRLRARGLPVVLTLHDHWFLCPEVQPYRPWAHPLHGDLRGAACFAHLELVRPLRLASMLAERGLSARARAHVERARLARAELAAADLVIVPSCFLRDRYAAAGLAAARMLVLPHGIVELPRAATRHEGVAVGYLGPLLHGKGPDLAVRAFRGVRNPAARLVLRGPEPDPRFARHVRRLARRDPRIAIGPPLPRAQVGPFLASLDLLVVPSRLHESFSLVAHEALACSVPVL